MSRVRTRYDVCAVVISDLAYDARVWKEARTLRESGRTVALIGCTYDVVDVRRRKESDIDVVEVSLGTRAGRVSAVARALTLLRVWREVLRTNARVYHVHNIHPGIAALVAARIRRARVVYDGHELYGEPHDRSARARLSAAATYALERLMVRRAAAVITTNGSRANVFATRHGRDDVVVLANVPNLQRSVVPLDPGFPRDVSVLLYQGGIYAESRPSGSHWRHSQLPPMCIWSFWGLAGNVTSVSFMTGPTCSACPRAYISYRHARLTNWYGQPPLRRSDWFPYVRSG